MDLQQFNDMLIAELKQYSIFSKYWSEQLISLINEPIELTYVPSGPLGFYQKEYLVMLNPIVADAILNETTASFTLLLTSNTSGIDLELITNSSVHRLEGKICTANAIIEVRASDGRILMSAKKMLWSDDPVDISGDPKYLKLIL